MSQIYKDLTSGPVPPSVPEQFTTDDGSIAVPAASNLNVFSRDTTANNANGVRTTADPNLSDNLYIELTNRLQGTATVVGAVTGDIITFNLGASAAVYRFNFIVAGRDTTSGDGVGYTVDGSARTNGAAATIIQTPFIDADEDASLVGALMNLVASGNTVILQPTGVAGRTISYSAVGNYVVV